MTRAAACIYLALALGACGDDTEAKLARCKTEVMAVFDAMLEAERNKSAPNMMAVNFMFKVGRPMIEGQLSWMNGPAGLDKCREVLAKNRPANGT
jgi:hypothetical protein